MIGSSGQWRAHLASQIGSGIWAGAVPQEHPRGGACGFALLLPCSWCKSTASVRNPHEVDTLHVLGHALGPSVPSHQLPRWSPTFEPQESWSCFPLLGLFQGMWVVTLAFQRDSWRPVL